MHPHLQQTAEEILTHHHKAILEALVESADRLRNLIRLDDHLRHGHEQAELSRSLGPFARSSMNLTSLSEVLGPSKSRRCMDPERRDHINQLIQTLENGKQTWRATFLELSSMDLNEPAESIHEAVELHLNRMARLFRDLRIAQLELKAKYSPDQHGPIFESFSWHRLSPNERRLCPPLLIVGEINTSAGNQLGKILSLLESGQPIKVVGLRSTLRKSGPPDPEPGMTASLAPEMAPLALRGVYFLQTHSAVPSFGKDLFAALSSPRPTFISLLAQGNDESEPDFKNRAEQAVRARAFPVIVYDPDQAEGFVSCFNLSANFDLPHDLDFAAFALRDPSYAEDFMDPGEDIRQQDLVPVNDFLQLDRRQRIGKWPCVFPPEDSGQDHPKIVSKRLLAQMAEQTGIWKTLMEFAGRDNPHVQRTREKLEAEYQSREKALVQALRVEKDKACSQAAQEARQAAVIKIVSQLTGMDPAAIQASLSQPSTS